MKAIPSISKPVEMTKELDVERNINRLGRRTHGIPLILKVVQIRHSSNILADLEQYIRLLTLILD